MRIDARKDATREKGCKTRMYATCKRDKKGCLLRLPQPNLGVDGHRCNFVSYALVSHICTRAYMTSRT
eukprot:scaffold82139_cov36-Prasinocladus_malaysianus.AAC.1